MPLLAAPGSDLRDGSAAATPLTSLYAASASRAPSPVPPRARESVAREPAVRARGTSPAPILVDELDDDLEDASDDPDADAIEASRSTPRARRGAPPRPRRR